MKIGILTYHRSHNYGALLQGIALRKALEEMGHQVTFVDYWPTYHRHMYALFSVSWMMSRNSFNGKINYLKSCITKYHYRRERKINFCAFIAEYIEPYTSSLDETYDVIVHGSDQIWRKQPEINIYNPVYFGNHLIKAQRKVSYAASMGILPQNDTDKATIKHYLSSLDYISVRESNLQKLVMGLGYSNVSLNLDPTLLLTQGFWVEHFGLKDIIIPPYALYYKIQDSFDETQLRKYVKSKGLQLKIVHSRARCAESEENITTANPLQFLQLIYGASIVFTSSFHGLAFSLIFHKQFYASFTKNEGRAASLLEQCKLNSRLLVPQSAIPSSESIDYSTVDTVLNKLREVSMINLEESISFEE